jgi:hypothetical protein
MRRGYSLKNANARPLLKSFTRAPCARVPAGGAFGTISTIALTT